MRLRHGRAPRANLPGGTYGAHARGHMPGGKVKQGQEAGVHRKLDTSGLSQADSDLQARAQQSRLNWTKGPDSPFEARKYNP